MFSVFFFFIFVPCIWIDFGWTESGRVSWNQIWCKGCFDRHSSIWATTGWIWQSLGIFECCWTTWYVWCFWKFHAIFLWTFKDFMTFVLCTLAEQLCEQERYFSLHNNDFEEELYKGNFFSMSKTAISISSITNCRRNSKKTRRGIRPSCI